MDSLDKKVKGPPIHAGMKALRIQTEFVLISSEVCQFIFVSTEPSKVLLLLFNE